MIRDFDGLVKSGKCVCASEERRRFVSLARSSEIAGPISSFECTSN